MEKELIPIQNMIYEVHGHKVMLDSDLATLYGVELRSLNQAVKRNTKRFPEDFMFQLTEEEWENLRSQFVISSYNHGGRRYLPYVFTEQGVSMLSSVINSDKAIEVNIQIMRAFIKLRNYIFSNETLNEQITELRKLLLLYMDKNDKRVNEIILALNNLLDKPKETKKIGFTA